MELSKSLRELILKSPELMVKLPVIFHGQNWRGKIPFVEKFGEFVKAVEFQKISVDDIAEIENILKLSPNIEKLVFVYCWMSKDLVLSVIELYDTWVEDEHNSRTVENDCNNNAWKWFWNEFPGNIAKVSKVERVCFLNPCDGRRRPLKYVSDFIAKQKSLEVLETDISGFCGNSLDDSEIRLQKLTLRKCYQPNQSLAKFLLTQKDSLKELICEKHLNFQYLKSIFKNFTSLRKLSIEIGLSLNRHQAEEIRDLKMPSVKELEVMDDCQDVTTVLTVINIFPNLEILIVESFHNFAHCQIFEMLPKLRKFISQNSTRVCWSTFGMFISSFSWRDFPFWGCLPCLHFWKKTIE